MTIALPTYERWRQVVRAPPRFARTIRGRIGFAFLALAAIIVVLGGLATLGIRTAGALVDLTYDRSLMSINYARAAAADFAGMQVAAERMRDAASGEERVRFKDRLDALAQAFNEDLDIAIERAQSARAAPASRPACSAR